jgi:hypothetical protein
MTNLPGQVALVTGAGRDISQEIPVRPGQLGASEAPADLRQDQAEPEGLQTEVAPPRRFNFTSVPGRRQNGVLFRSRTGLCRVRHRIS